MALVKAAHSRSVIRKVQIEDREEVEGVMRQVEEWSSDITWMQLMYGMQKGCHGFGRDVRRLMMDDFGGGGLELIVENLPEDQVAFAIFNYGKGGLIEMEKARKEKAADAKKWTGVMQGSKQAQNRWASLMLRQWGRGAEVCLAEQEALRLREMARDLQLQVPEPGSDWPMEQIQMLCSANCELDRVLLAAVDGDASLEMETEKEDGYPSDTLFQARMRVVEDLEMRVAAETLKREDAAAKTAKVAREGAQRGAKQGEDVATSTPTGARSKAPIVRKVPGKAPGGLTGLGALGGGEGGSEGRGQEAEEALKNDACQRTDKVDDDRIDDAEEAFQRQVEADAREMGLRMEKATTLLQRFARGWLVRRARQTVMQLKGWSLPQLAASKLKTILIIAWIPRTAHPDFVHSAEFHLRTVVELLGRSATVKDAVIPHVVIKVGNKEQLQGAAVAQAIAESYNVMGVERRRGKGDEMEDEQASDNLPLFGAHEEYASVVGKYRYLLQNDGSQLLERRSDQRGATSNDASGDCKVRQHNEHTMSASQELIYSSKHHYCDRNIWDGLKARTRYTGHVRALASEKKKTQEKRVAAAEASGSSIGSAGVGGDSAADRAASRASKYGDMVFKHKPWWCLTFPVKWRGTNKETIGAALAPSRRAGDDKGGGRVGAGVASLLHFRAQSEKGSKLSVKALKAVFAAKCKELGVSMTTEQEALFVSNSSKMMTEEASSHLLSMGFRDVGLGAKSLQVLLQSVVEEGLAVCCLDLSCNALRDSGAALLAALLPQLPLLTTLDVRSTFIGPNGQKALFDAVSQNTVLTSIDLGFLGESGRNVIGSKGCAALADMLHVNSVLSTLSLAANRMSSRYANELNRGMECNITLRQLDLSDNDLGDAGALAVATGGAGKLLRSLSLARNGITDRGVKGLIDMLQSPDVMLETLNIAGNVMSVESAIELGERICRINTSLTSLSLDKHLLKADGAKGLMEALMPHEIVVKDSYGRAIDSSYHYPKALVRLKLSRNELCNDGARYVASMLRFNSTLTYLDLSHNSISDSGASEIGSAMRSNFGMEHLSLAFNRIADRGVVGIASALHSNASLVHLDIQGNQFSDDGCRALLLVLPTATSLTDLRIDQNDVRFDFYEAIHSLLANHQRRYKHGAQKRLKEEAERLQRVVSRSDELVAKLAVEKRLLYRSTMDIDETKLKRLEDRAERTEVMHQTDARKNHLRERSSAAEEGYMEVEAELNAAKTERSEVLNLLNWQKEQGIVQRDRLRRRLTSQHRTIADEKEEEKRWTRSLTEDTLAIVESEIAARKEWRQCVQLLSSFIETNCEVPGMMESPIFNQADNFLADAMSYDEEDELTIKDHELKDTLGRLATSNSSIQLSNFQKAGRRFGKLNLGLQNVLVEARQHSEEIYQDLAITEDEEAKAAAAKERRARHRVASSDNSSDSESHTSYSQASSSRDSGKEDNCPLRDSGEEDNFQQEKSQDADKLTDHNHPDGPQRKKTGKKKSYKRISGIAQAVRRRRFSAIALATDELMRRQFHDEGRGSSPLHPTVPLPHSSPHKETVKVSKILTKHRKGLRGRGNAFSLAEGEVSQSSPSALSPFLHAPSSPSRLPPASSKRAPPSPISSSFKRDAFKGDAFKRDATDSRSESVMPDVVFQRIPGASGDPSVRPGVVSMDLGADYAAEALDNLQGIMSAHQHLVERSRAERVRLMEVIRQQMESKQRAADASTQDGRGLEYGGSGLPLHNLTSKRGKANRRRSVLLGADAMPLVPG